MFTHILQYLGESIAYSAISFVRDVFPSLPHVRCMGPVVCENLFAVAVYIYIYIYSRAFHSDSQHQKQKCTRECTENWSGHLIEER